MLFTVQQAYIMEPYFRTGVKYEDGQWYYSLIECGQDILQYFDIPFLFNRKLVYFSNGGAPTQLRSEMMGVIIYDLYCRAFTERTERTNNILFVEKYNRSHGIGVPYVCSNCTITCFGFHARRIDGVKCGLFSNHAPLGQNHITCVKSICSVL